MSLYIPRGYVSTSQAVVNLFKARHPELLASTLARSAEMRRLYERYRAEFPGNYPPPATLMDAVRLRDARSKRLAIIAGAVGWRDALRHANSNPEQLNQWVGTFGEEHLARLRELDGIASEAKRLHTKAAIELRAALAEGDLSAVVLSDSGDWETVSLSHWLGKNGLKTVWESRLRVQVEATHTVFVDGTVMLKEADLTAWMRSILPADRNASVAETLTDMSTTMRQGIAPPSQPGDVWRKLVEAAGTTDKALIAWAEKKYPDGPPGRERLLYDHRLEFGPIRGINEKSIGAAVRRKLASAKSKRGGTPTHHAIDEKKKSGKLSRLEPM